MRLRFCFVLCNYLLAALGVTCLIFGEVIATWAGVGLLALLALFLVLELQKALPLKPPDSFSFWKIGAILLPPIYLALQPEVIDLLVWVLLVLQMTRFVFKTEFNDYLFSYLIAIVCLLMGALFIRDLVFGMMFFSFYLILCWGFMFYNMMVERVGSHCPPDEFRHAGDKETVGFPLVTFSTSIIFLSLALTAAIFMSFPRLGLGFMDFKVSGPPISGFSDRVTLGEVGRIKQNESVVMRVEFRKNNKPYRPKSTLLWRGVALDFYDGTTWSSTMPVVRRWRNWTYNGIQLFDSHSLKNVVEQNIFMETFNSPVLLTHGLPVFMEGSFDSLQMDQSYSLKTFDGYSGPRRFKLFSVMDRLAPTYPDPLPQKINNLFPQRFLQLPEINRKMLILARDLVGATDHPGHKAEKIRNYLRTNFTYSLDMQHLDPGNSAIEDFLFNRKKGHCEYFASAMVLLLRLNQIPARIVNGFMGTEWNELGNYMIVRQAHAHSWVEAYIPGEGWRVYDPTPQGPVSAETRATTFSRGLDLLRLHWQRYVVKYSLKDQFHLVQFFNRETQEMTRQLKALKSLSFKDLTALLRNRLFVALVLTVMTLLLWKFRPKGGWFPLRSGERPPTAVQVYHQMLHRLEKFGCVKSRSTSHNEFLGQLHALPEDKLQIVREITRVYEQFRFGRRSLPPEDRQHLKHLVRQL